MADEHMPHKLCLNERRQLTMTGVTEVVSFDDTTVVLQTSLGTLIVQRKGIAAQNPVTGGRAGGGGRQCFRAGLRGTEAGSRLEAPSVRMTPPRWHQHRFVCCCLLGQRWGCITNSYIPCVHGILLPRTRCF